jgi:hypothetical protein
MTQEEFNAAARIAEIYFNIAAEAIGEDEVRRRRDLILDGESSSPKAKFKVIEQTDEYILIKDECIKHECMSITNDAEAVVEYLLKNYSVRNKKIYYIDTAEQVDELEHNNEKFIGFKPGYEDIHIFRAYNVGEEI